METHAEVKLYIAELECALWWAHRGLLNKVPTPLEMNLPKDSNFHVKDLAI